MEVFTNIPGKPGGFWHGHTVLVGPQRPSAFLIRCLGRSWATRLVNIAVAIRLFFLRSPRRGFVTGGGLDGILFAILQTLFSWNRRPHVLVDCNWYLPGSLPSRWLRRLTLGIAARSVRHFVVWAWHEVDDYARAFGLAKEQLLYVPFHTTLDYYQFD